VATTLLQAGAEVDPLDSYGHTPLYEAASQGRHDVVELLLEHCADHHLRTAAGGSVLEMGVAEVQAGFDERPKQVVDSGRLGWKKSDALQRAEGWRQRQSAARPSGEL
jgi:ankyrin repeat protein